MLKDKKKSEEEMTKSSLHIRSAYQNKKEYKGKKISHLNKLKDFHRITGLTSQI
jgi:hypothetical protein